MDGGVDIIVVNCQLNITLRGEETDVKKGNKRFLHFGLQWPNQVQRRRGMQEYRWPAKSQKITDRPAGETGRAAPTINLPQWTSRWIPNVPPRCSRNEENWSKSFLFTDVRG